MTIIDFIALVFTSWAIYITVAAFHSTAKHDAAMVEYRKLLQEKATKAFFKNLSNGPHENPFGGEPAQPFSPPTDPYNVFAQYDAKLAAADPADYEPTDSSFSVN